MWLFDQFDNPLNSTGHVRNSFVESNVGDVMNALPVTSESATLLLNVLPANAVLPAGNRVSVQVICNGTNEERVEERAVEAAENTLLEWEWASGVMHSLASTTVTTSEDTTNFRAIVYTVTLHDTVGNVFSPSKFRLLVSHQTPDNATSYTVVFPSDVSFSHTVMLQRRGVHRVTLHVVDSEDVAEHVFSAEYSFNGGVATSFFVYGNGTVFPMCSENTCAGQLFVGGKVGDGDTGEG